MENLVVIPGNKPKPWASSGAMKKPMGCKACKYQKVGYGFCPDWVGKDVKLGVMLAAPGNDDINMQSGLSGAMGWMILNKFFKPHNLTKDNLIVSHVIRCKPPLNKGRRGFPTGATKTNAEKVCRQYDSRSGKCGSLVVGGLQLWNPNMCLLTFDPLDCHINPSYIRQIQRDVARALWLYDKGFSVLMLMGKEAAELFAPHIKNNYGLKGWRGDYFEIDSLNITTDFDGKEGFKSV
jgi:hypothetical protein